MSIDRDYYDRKHGIQREHEEAIRKITKTYKDAINALELEGVPKPAINLDDFTQPSDE